MHRDGWILGYYPIGDPVSRIYDWYAYHNGGRADISTRLENTLAVVASAGGLPYSGVNYYDFRHPNASHLLLIVEWMQGSGRGGSESFSVKLPANYGYYERSWSFGSSGCWDPATLLLNGALIGQYDGGGVTGAHYGLLTAGQMVPEQTHWVTVVAPCDGEFAYGGLVLMYRVP